jgi:pimeloyl-ACP methyl ester carboxylesterase
MLKQVDIGVLKIAYLDFGETNGNTVILLHGFPYDVHSYDEVTLILAQKGYRVVIPYLRGYGPTEFVDTSTIRSGQQAALAHDLLSFMDALEIPKAILAGYDWGGRAACVVAALWPFRVQALVSVGGYNIQNIPKSIEPQKPGNEYRYWYQYYLHSERGRAGLTKNRYEFCKFLWQLWSPTWKFTEQDFYQTADSFNNPDFVDVVIHSYRHRFGLVSGDPVFDETEVLLSKMPKISVPVIAMDGREDGVAPLGGSINHRCFFNDYFAHRIISNAGHNLPQEAPIDFSEAVISITKEVKNA